MKYSPCYKCNDRYPGCHSHCEKEEYKADRAERQLIYEEKCRLKRSQAKTYKSKRRLDSMKGEN